MHLECKNRNSKSYVEAQMEKKYLIIQGGPVRKTLRTL